MAIIILKIQKQRKYREMEEKTNKISITLSSQTNNALKINTSNRIELKTKIICKEKFKLTKDSQEPHTTLNS